MSPARIVLGVLMACGLAASAGIQQPRATAAPITLLRESTSSKSSPGRRLMPSIVKRHCSSCLSA